MEPHLSLVLRDAQREFQPGDLLAGEYQVDAVSADDVTAIEFSVLWYTEGKGDEDLSVHFFKRRTPAEDPDQDLRGKYAFETTLPNSPWSYAGVSLRIRWCVRLRVFLERGREMSMQIPFQLGQAEAANPVEIPRTYPVSVAGDSDTAQRSRGRPVSESL